MTEHLSARLLERYHRHKLAPAESLALDDHLAVCETCRNKLQEAIPARATLLALQSGLQTEPNGASDHPPREQLSAYVGGWLNEVDREVIESHFEFCPQCAAQVDEFRATVEQRAEVPSVSSVSADAPIAQLSPWAKILDLFSHKSWSFPPALRVAGAIGIATLLVLALSLWLQSRIGKRDDVVITPSPIPSSPSPQISINPSPEATAPILLALNDGAGLVTLDAQGNLTGLDALSPFDRQRVVRALQTLKVETPSELANLGASAGALMGKSGDDSFALLSPVSEIIFSNRPTLRWRPLPGAINYTAKITDPEKNYSEVAACSAIAECKVDRALKRGRIYAWVVTANKDGKEITAPSAGAGEAKFKVLEQVKADELLRARKVYAGTHLTIGLLYARAGLLDEAEREFKSLVAANPQSSIAKSLLRDLQTKRRTR